GSFIILLYSLINIFLRRRCAGAILDNVGNQYKGVDCIVPVINRIDSLSCTSILFVWAMFSQTEAQYSAVGYISPSTVVLNADAPQEVAVNFLTILFLVRNFEDVLVRCWLNVNDLSILTPRSFGQKLCLSCFPLNLTLNFALANLLFKWKQQTSILSRLGVNRHLFRY